MTQQETKEKESTSTFQASKEAVPAMAVVTPTKQKLTTTQKILIVGIALILIVLIVGGILFFLYLNKPEAQTGPGTGNLVMDNGFDLNPEKAADNMFEVKMNAIWTFPDGASPSVDAYVANSTANHWPFYFDLTVPETGEILYTSPEIPLGSAVKDIVLERDLEAGKYEYECNYHTMPGNGAESDTVTVTVTVVVEK